MGRDDMFFLGKNIIHAEYGIENHRHMLLKVVMLLFYSLRLHHIAKLNTLTLQRNSLRQKYNKTVFFKGH